MLVPVAVDSVTFMKYRPFESDGKTVSAITTRIIKFGHPYRPNEDRDRQEIAFQDAFWPALDSGQSGLERRDLAGAEAPLKTAGETLSRAKAQALPISYEEAGSWLITMGVLSQRQQKYDDAERYYRQALDSAPSRDNNSAVLASAFGHLGALYAEQNKYDLARERLLQSIAVYKKNFKKADSSEAGVLYGQAIASGSSTLFLVAVRQEKYADAAQQCSMLPEFKSYLSPADQSSRISVSKACRWAEQQVASE